MFSDHDAPFMQQYSGRYIPNNKKAITSKEAPSRFSHSLDEAITVWRKALCRQRRVNQYLRGGGRQRHEMISKINSSTTVARVVTHDYFKTRTPRSERANEGADRIAHLWKRKRRVASLGDDATDVAPSIAAAAVCTLIQKMMSILPMLRARDHHPMMPNRRSHQAPPGIRLARIWCGSIH